ncbi:MAG: hypothetical protein WAW02_01545 [Sideroxyarcus sp.]
MSLQLTVMDAQENPLGQSALARLGEQRVQLGKNLYVYLLQARPDNGTGFPADALMYYRLDKVEAENNFRSPLCSDEDIKKLVYGSFPYPSFFIPTKLKNLLHGSCRKPHGGFNPKKQKHVPDALSHGHTLLEKTCNDMEHRPAVLLLTGDQIYADDVAVSLLAMLQQQSLTLVGKQEKLPLYDGITLPAACLDPSAIPLHGRKQVLKDKHSGFSSTESENHLFTFGEYAAMYIYSFGNLPAWEPVWDWQQLAGLGVADDADKAWAKQLEPLSFFDNTLPDIRRLMANVPTYMIFDDHDVTDDWNINGHWYDDVRESPMGRRIVSNGLAANWGFQARGNDPDNFNKDLILTIVQHLNDTENDSDIGERYDLHTWKNRGWGFSIPCEPPIIAVDCRTQRQYENKYFPAQLLDRYALDWLRVEWTKLRTGQKIDSNTCPVLITSSPVMGYSVVEFFQRMLLWLTNKVESYRWVQFLEQLLSLEGFLTGMVVKMIDAESWNSNKGGFVNFLDTICLRMGITRCVFLSGDVHYAFTASASFLRKNSQLHCYQLTSSSLSNEPDVMQSRFLEKGACLKTGTRKHCNWGLSPSLRWRTEEQLLKAMNSDLRVSAECNLGLAKFADGLPVSHTLLTGSGNLVYRLPGAGGS